MVAFGPQGIACETESAGWVGRNAVTLWQQDLTKTPGQASGRAFALTATGEEVRQFGFTSPNRTRTRNRAVNRISEVQQP